MQAYSRQQFARALVKIMSKHPVKHVAKAAAAEMVNQRWTKLTDLVVKDIAAELWRSKKHLCITIQSARELPRALQERIAKVLADKSGAKSTSIEAEIHPEVKGGFRAFSPAGELDATVVTKLNQLKQRH